MTDKQKGSKDNQSNNVLEARFFQSRTVIVAGEINHLLALTGALTVVVDQRRNLNFNFE